MMKLTFNFIMRLWFFFILSVTSQIVWAKPPVLDAYPNCEYDVIDTSKRSIKISKVSDSFDPQDVAPALERLIQRFQNEAQDAAADAVVLIQRDINLVNSLGSGDVILGRYHTIDMTAEFIKVCKNVPGIVGEPAPFNAFGEPQTSYIFSVGTAKSFQMKIEMDKRKISPITTSTVNLEKGVYGVKLGISAESLVETLGDPTLELTLNDTNILYAYGRSMWLLFSNDTLVWISSSQPWLSFEFTNVLAFDERFDDNLWDGLFDIVEDAVVENEKLKNVISSLEQNNKQHCIVNLQLSENELLVSDDHSTLKYIFDDYLIQNSSIQGERNKKAVGFVLSKVGFIMPEIKIPEVPESLANDLNTILVNGTGEISLNAYQSQIKGRAWLSDAKSVYWLGGKVVFETIGSSLNKAYFFENFSVGNDVSKPWEVRGIAQYTPLDEAMQMLPDDVFQLGDTIEITFPDITHELFFYEVDNESILISSEISFY